MPFDWIPDHLVKSLAAGLAVLTSMITPALLISACGTFILSTSSRLGRAVDRVRALSDSMDTLMSADSPIPLTRDRRDMMFDQMSKLSGRATLLAHILTIFYMASGIFVATSVAIGVVSLAYPKSAWIPVALALIGACFLFCGSILLIFEARLAVRGLRSELDFLGKQILQHTQGRTSPEH